jgi:hypothetical protein
MQEVPGSFPGWDAAFSDALCKGCRWLWSSHYSVLCGSKKILTRRHTVSVSGSCGSKKVLTKTSYCIRIMWKQENTHKDIELYPDHVVARKYSQRRRTVSGSYGSKDVVLYPDHVVARNTHKGVVLYPDHMEVRKYKDVVMYPDHVEARKYSRRRHTVSGSYGSKKILTKTSYCIRIMW